MMRPALRFQQDPKAWRDDQEELKSLEETLMDDLDSNEGSSPLRKDQPAEQKIKEKQLA